MNTRFAGWTLLLLVAIGVALGPIASVEAAQVRGTPVDIAALDDAGATTHQQLKFGIGRIVAMCVGCFGLLGLVTGYVWTGASGAVGGFGSAFMPGGISSAYDAAPAADGWLAPVTPWLNMVSGFVGDRLIHDPTFYVALAVAAVLLVVSKRSRQVGIATA